MKLIIGLGNPDKEYLNNRHNVGHMVAERLVTSNKAQVTSTPHSKLVTCYMLPVTKDLVAKTNVFMNDSGNAVSKLVNFYKVDLNDLYVVYDDLDIPLGSYKISKGKSPRVHNGILSVIEKLGSEDFWHVRIGVDNRKVPEVPNVPKVPKAQRPSGRDYVLSDFTDEEKPVLEKVIDEVVRLLCGSQGQKE